MGRAPRNVDTARHYYFRFPPARDRFGARRAVAAEVFSRFPGDALHVEAEAYSLA